MRLKGLDLNLLVALDSLLTLCSVSAAANQLNMSQPAMSNALSRLRDYFDDPLLAKVGRDMVLTPKARSLQSSVRDLLLRAEATILAEQSFNPAASTREFRVVLVDYSLAILAPIVMALLSHQAEHVQIHFLPPVIDAGLCLERGEADLLVSPTQFLARNHPSIPLFSDNYACVTWKDSKWRRGTVTEDTYLAASHAAHAPNGMVSQALDAVLLEEIGIERRIGVTATSMTQLPYLVVGSERIATLPSRMAALAVRSLPLDCHPLPFFLPPLVQHLQWIDYRISDPGCRWLRDVFCQAARELSRQDQPGTD